MQERKSGRVPGPHAGNRVRKLQEAKKQRARATRDSLPLSEGGSGGCDAAPSQKKEGNAHVAQSAERVLGKDEVISSILIVGSNLTGERRQQARSEAGFTPA